MIRVRPELRITITRYSSEDLEDDMEESSLGSSCAGAGEESQDKRGNCSGEQSPMSPAGGGGGGYLKGKSSSNSNNQSRTPSPSGSHHLLNTFFASAPPLYPAPAPCTSSLHRLTVNNTPTLLTLDWTEASNSNKFHRINQQLSSESTSPVSPSRNYQERLILPLG